MSIIVDGRKITEFSPGASGTIAEIEAGRSELARFMAMELTGGTKVSVRK
ncbi:MAG: Fe2+ transport system protein FeoA [Desulforhopalus sp.]|jgi:Fe2+ transport system protein FeoA